MEIKGKRKKNGRKRNGRGGAGVEELVFILQVKRERRGQHVPSIYTT